MLRVKSFVNSKGILALALSSGCMLALAGPVSAQDAAAQVAQLNAEQRAEIARLEQAGRARPGAVERCDCRQVTNTNRQRC